LGADTAIAKYARNTLNAVSAGLISRDDLLSTEPSAKIRVKLGQLLYRDKQDKELLILNFAYRALFLLTEGIKGAKSSKEHSEIVYEYYGKLWNRILDRPAAVETESHATENELTKMYRYLFKK